MKFTILMTALVISIFLSDEGWAAASLKKVTCENNGVTIVVDALKKRTFVTRKKGHHLVTLPMGRVKKSELQVLDDQNKSVFNLSNKSKIEVSFNSRSNVGIGYGVLTSGKTGRLYDLGDCVSSRN